MQSRADAAIIGQALLLNRSILYAYAAIAALAMAAFARLYEKPALERRFGAAYDTDRSSVPAWIPRRPGRRSNRR